MAVTDRPTDTQPHSDGPRRRRGRYSSAGSDEPRLQSDDASDESIPSGEPVDSAETRAASDVTDATGDATRPAPEQPSAVEPRLVEAFREMHARRLHAFALLLALGDRPRAARLTDDALTAAAPLVGGLAHPERGAAWLRRQVYGDKLVPDRVGRFRRLLRRRRRSISAVPEIGASVQVVAALAELPLRDRAALILSDVERLRELDVAEVLGCKRSAVEEIVRNARARFGRAFVDVSRADGTIETTALPSFIEDAAVPALRRRRQPDQ